MASNSKDGWDEYQHMSTDEKLRYLAGAVRAIAETQGGLLEIVEKALNHVPALDKESKAHRRLLDNMKLRWQQQAAVNQRLEERINAIEVTKASENNESSSEQSRLREESGDSAERSEGVRDSGQEESTISSEPGIVSDSKENQDQAPELLGPDSFGGEDFPSDGSLPMPWSGRRD